MQRFACKKSAMAAAVMLSLAGAVSAQTYPLPSACDTPAQALAASLVNWKLVDALVFQDYSPLMVNHANVPTLRRNTVYVPPANRVRPERRIVVFGDSHGVDKHLPPVADPDVRALFQRADLVIGNLESPLVATSQAGIGGDGIQSSNFHMTRDYLARFSAQMGIAPAKAVYSVANNHANDNDRWKDTLASVDALKLLGFRFTGIESPLASFSFNHDVTAVDLGGMKVGVLGWTHVENTSQPTGYRPWLTDERAIYKPNALTLKPEPRDYNAIKSQLGLKMLIGVPHWDCQLQSYPHKETVAQAKLLMQNGMDLVMGMHQSTPQPANEGMNLASNKRTLAFYGLGQLFINTGKTAGIPGLSSAVELVVDGTGQVVEFTFHPLIRRTLSAPRAYTAVDAGPGAPVGAPIAEIVTLARAKADADAIRQNDPDSAIVRGTDKIIGLLDKLFPN